MYGDSTFWRTVHIVTTEYLVHDSARCLTIFCMSFIQINLHVTLCGSCRTDWNLVGFSRSSRISDISCATLATSEHTAEIVILRSIFRINDLRTYCATIDIHRRILSHSTNLATTINTALDSTSSHVQCRSLTLTEFWPQWKQCCIIQRVESSHTAREHITTLGILQMVLIVEGSVRYRSDLSSCRIIDIFIVVTNGTATDVDFNVPATFIIISRSFFCTWVRIRTVVLVVWTQDTVRLNRFCIFSNLFIYQIETIAYRCQTTAAIDGAKHPATFDVQFYRATYVTCCQRLTTETATATEHVTIYV